jgi:hypothetical protein
MKVQLTNSFGQSSSREANSYSGDQEIPHPSQNLKLRYCVHKSPPEPNESNFLPYFS